MRKYAIPTECTWMRCSGGGLALCTRPPLGRSCRQNAMANIKTRSLTSLIPSLSASLLGAFLLAAIDQAEGQAIKVSWSASGKPRR